MPQIRPITDLRNTNEIETYEEMLETASTDAAIAAAEADYAKTGQLHDAETALAALRRKHFEQL